MSDSRKRNSVQKKSGTKARPAAPTGKRRKRKNKRVKYTFILVGLMLFLLAAGSLSVFVLRSGFLSREALPYDVNREFTNTVLAADNTRCESFAAELCVSEGDVELEDVYLDYDQTGLLMNLSDKAVLFAQGMYDRIYPASITKIMTALLVLRNGNLQDEVTISQNDLNLEAGSQVCGFEAGDKVTVEQLLNCLLVYSGNDAAMALANHVGGSEKNFVEMMNACAKELGMTGTHFCNPHGLHDQNHYTTTYDIYLMLKEAYKFPLFTEISSKAYYDVVYKRADGESASIHMNATDYYLSGDATTPRNVTVLGGKTGTTDEAGNCLAIITENADGKSFISIVLNAYEKPYLYTQMNSLLQNLNESPA